MYTWNERLTIQLDERIPRADTGRVLARLEDADLMEEFLAGLLDEERARLGDLLAHDLERLLARLSCPQMGRADD